MAFEAFFNSILIITIVIAFITLFLAYFIYRLIKKNQKLINQEQPEMIKDVKTFLKK